MKGFEIRLSSYGVGAVEYTVLSVCMAVKQISIKDLRGLVPIDYAHLSRTTSRLEDMGLIEKVRLRGDRRVVNLRMTEEGLSLMPELTRRVQGYYALLVSDFSQEELAGYMGVIEKMIAGGEEEKETPMRGGGGRRLPRAQRRVRVNLSDQEQGRTHHDRPE